MRSLRLLACAFGTILATACSDGKGDESASATTHLEQAPAALACLARHFTGMPKSTANGAWVLALPSGRELPWDDGRVKTFDQTLDQADLQDTLSIPYRTGPITPVTQKNDDPGRIRIDELFKATYGASADAVRSKLVDVDFLGNRVRFHSIAAPALTRVAARLETLVAADPSLAAYLTGELGGTFNWRVIANTTRLSGHSFATAIDIVVAKSNYWQWEVRGDTVTWKNQIPQAIVDAFEAEGFVWGGRWYHYDTMHFEYRPELFDRDCAL